MILKFLILSIPILYLSRRNLLHPHTHGFSRFFGWEALAWLFLSNLSQWFVNPFSALQIVSWVLLSVSACLVINGGWLLLRKGKPSSVQRDDAYLMGFEKTTRLVDTGVYRYIRHPLYASLIFLSWAFALKSPELIQCGLALFCTLMFYITSRYDEKECVHYFGSSYTDYMKKTRMFIPFIW